MAKEGSTISGLMDTIATMTSVSLQYGVPLRDLVNKFAHVRFEPAGFTGNPEIPIAKSIVDYVFRWMGSRFLSKEDREALGLIGGAIVAEPPASAITEPPDLAAGIEDSTAAAPPPAPSTSAGGEGGARPAGAGPTLRVATPAAPTAKTPQREWRRARDSGTGAILTPRGGPASGLLGQCGLTELRRLRQHHGSQRQLLQVPQLRLHERLLLT